MCIRDRDKRHENDAVQPNEMGEGVKKVRAVGEQTYIPGIDVGKQPNDKSGRRRNGDGTAQHKKSSVKDRTNQYPANLWAAIGRQL